MYENKNIITEQEWFDSVKKQLGIINELHEKPSVDIKICK